MTLDADFLRPGGALGGRLFARLLRDRGLPREPSAGERFGPFRTVSELGRGGMALVYLAERADGAVEQRVALKLLHRASANDAVEALFRRERQLLASFTHAGIARFLDAGQREDGLPWVAMEYVDGAPLLDHARGLSRAARVDLLLQVCEAVDYAHQRLVVHRDIKPSNVMVTTEGRVKLLDFGIASLAEEPDLGAGAMTPGWASPEQRAGETVTTASDVYQLGLLAARVLGAEASEAATSVVLGERDLDAIIARATRTVPGERYARAAELARDLRAWREHRPVDARAGGPGYRLGKLLRRRPWLSTFAAVTGLVLALLAAQLARERDSARRQAERAQQAAARAQSALDFLTDLLGQAQPAVHRGAVPTVSDLLDRGAARLIEGQEPPVLRAELLNALGRIHIERGEFAQAARALEAARTLFPLAEIDAATRAEAAGNLAYALDYRESPRAFALLDEADGLLARDDTRVAMRLRFHRYRCGVLHGTGQIDAAEKCLRALIAEATRRVGAHHVETASARLWWAMALDDLDRRDEAVAAAASGYEDLRLALGATHPRVVDAGGIYVSRLHNSGRHAEEETRLRELIPQVEKLWGEQHPKVARYLTWQGSAISAQGRPTEAIAILERALAIYDAAPAHDDLGSPNTLSALGEAYARLNQPDRALGYFARMRARQDERPSAVPPDDGWRSLPPIIVARESGRLDIAAQWLRDARARAGTATPSPIHAQLDFQSALYYEARQQRALAVDCIVRAVRMTRESRDPDMLSALERLAPEAVAEDARTTPACPTP